MAAPLTPADCDLRDFAFMPVDAVRLFGSEFHAVSSDGAWRAGVTLWLKAWHQVPAGSLPNEDIQLARLAEFGRDVRGWTKIKTEALRGWVDGGDGRLYHPVVAEKALEAWLEKLAQRISSGAGNAKRWKTAFDAAPIERQIADAVAMLEDIAPHSKAIAKAKRRHSQRDDNGKASGIPTGLPTGSQETGTGTGNTIPLSNDNGGSADPDAVFWRDAKAWLKPKVKGDPGALLNKWMRDHGKDMTVAALNAAQMERAVDPTAYVQAYMRRQGAAAAKQPAVPL